MTGPQDNILTQLNIRNNVREMQDSMKELYAWEKEMESKDKAVLRKKKAGQQDAASPAVRGRATAVAAPSDAALQDPAAALQAGDLASRFALLHTAIMI
jgi:hypothetical protein